MEVSCFEPFQATFLGREHFDPIRKLISLGTVRTFLEGFQVPQENSFETLGVLETAC